MDGEEGVEEDGGMDGKRRSGAVKTAQEKTRRQASSQTCTLERRECAATGEVADGGAK